jgi:hypothetical protein
MKNIKIMTLFLLWVALVLPPAVQGDETGSHTWPWGSTLEELKSRYRTQGRPGLTLREETSVYDIELQINASHTQKITRGALTMVEEVSTEAGASTVGRVFGYLWEGRLFGRVAYFDDKPGQTRSQVTRQLKALFPEGRLFHRLSGGVMTSDFEWDSSRMLIFTTSRGVYFYEPSILKRVQREAERERQEQADREGERKFKEEVRKPY